MEFIVNLRLLFSLYQEKNINDIHLLWFAISNRDIANNSALNDKVHYSGTDYKLETLGWV